MFECFENRCDANEIALVSRISQKEYQFLLVSLDPVYASS